MRNTLKKLVYENMEKCYGKILAKKVISSVKFDVTGRHTLLDKRMPLDDKKTFALFQNGETTGTISFGFRGMRRLLKDAKPANLNELAALLALWRPGPMEIGLTDHYVKMKNSSAPLKFITPELEPILRETYGCIIYQEQIMIIAHKIGGLTMKEADLFRQTLGKGLPCKEIKELFIKGARKRGIKKEKGAEIFNLCRNMAGYAFLKARALACALMDYQIMYQKVKNKVV